MIKQIEKSDIMECVKVIRESYLTVADEFGFFIHLWLYGKEFYLLILNFEWSG